LALCNRIIGEQIADARRKRGKTQQTLAEDAHLSTKHISNLERGEKEASLKAIFSIAEALGVSPGSLLDDSGRISEPQGLDELSELLCDCSEEEHILLVSTAVGLLKVLKQSLRDNRLALSPVT
jgi:transcriptional regulator with XRE-family HTH domain